MQMPLTIVADEFVGHGEQGKSNPRPFKSQKGRPPGRQRQSLGVDVLEWYHAIVRGRQQKKRQRVGHPPKSPL
jgi:hypothetical protein